MKTSIDELIELSRQIGAREDFVQGGGGNISIKVNNDIMLIKSSGYFLKDLTTEKGYTAVKYPQIRSFFNNKNGKNLKNIVSDSVLQISSGGNGRPSIETGFHAILGNVVLHTHSSYANILTCSVEGKKLRKDILSMDSIWVEYSTPGEELTQKIKDSLGDTECQVIFLQNHGLIIWGKTPKEVLDLHRKVNDELIKYFNINHYKPEQNFSISYIRDNILFPDQVVYTETDETLKTIAARETLDSYCFILSEIKKNNLTPSFISLNNASVISNLESEKYRKGMVK